VCAGLTRELQVDVLVYPVLAVLLERRLYDAREPHRSWNPFSRAQKHEAEAAPEGTAIALRDLRKTFNNGRVVAVGGLTLDVPAKGIFVLLGSNGAGKSTVLPFFFRG
jgi:ATP-binding cassette subfamily A (ABC1) protein 3